VTDPSVRPSLRRSLWKQLPLLVGLVLLWMLLWGEVTWLSALSGVLIALLVTRLFYLPPVELSGRFNPLWAVVLALRFLGEVVVSSVAVGALAFTPGKLAPNAIIEVQLRTRSDFIVSLVAIIVALVPGTLVLEIDRSRAILFLHVLAAGDARGVEKARAHTLATEAAVVRAFGSRADLERCR
jgi:multicomponent Na+:H+ antiporter subunit E